MALNPTWLFLALIPSGVGFALLVYGKKQGRWPHAVAGLALSAFAFTDTTAALVAVGALIGVCLWIAIRLGW